MENSKVVLHDFWAAWCGPCKVMNPIIEQIGEEYKGRASVEKINLDDPVNQTKVDQFQITAVPTYIVEKDGQIVDQLVGAQHKKALTDAIDNALG